MGAIFREAVAWVNLPYSILLLLTIIYWITVLLGLLDAEVIDFEVEMDGFLGIMNIGSVPFSVWLSIFSVQTWIYSLILNGYANGWGLLNDLLFLRFLLVGVIIVPFSAFTTKWITTPLKKLLAEKTIKKKDFIGSECLITSSRVDEDFGTAEIKTEGVPQIIDVRARKENGIEKGDKVLICDYNAADDIFIVEKV